MTRRPIPCSICKKLVAAEAKTYPFCSDRCRMLDLGNWLGDRYAIPGPDVDEDQDSPRPDDPESLPH